MTVVELLNQWREKKLDATEIVSGLTTVGITPEVRDNRLYFPRGAAPPELLEIVSAHEADVIAILKTSETPAEAPKNLASGTVQHAPEQQS